HCCFVGEPANYFYSLFQQRWAEHFVIKTPKIGFNDANEKLPPAGSGIARSGSLVCQITDTFGNPQRANPFGNFPNAPRLTAEQNLNFPHRLEFNAPFLPGPASPFLDYFISVPLVTVSDQFFLSKDPEGIDILLHEQNQPRLYKFAPKGHHGIYDFLKNAIE